MAYQGQPQMQGHPQMQGQPPMQHHPSSHGPHGGANLPESGWNASLWDCCSPMDSCLIGCCLPCILLGKTSERMRDPSMRSYETINTDCLVHLGINCFTGCGWIFAMMKRSEIRERYNIKGSGMNDCCVSYWCGCCALMQQDKEVIHRSGPAAPVTQGYQAQKEGMQMPPPQQQHMQMPPQQAPPQHFQPQQIHPQQQMPPQYMQHPMGAPPPQGQPQYGSK